MPGRRPGRNGGRRRVRTIQIWCAPSGCRRLLQVRQFLAQLHRLDLCGPVSDKSDLVSIRESHRDLGAEKALRAFGGKRLAKRSLRLCRRHSDHDCIILDRILNIVPHLLARENETQANQTKQDEQRELHNGNILLVSRISSNVSNSPKKWPTSAFPSVRSRQTPHAKAASPTAAIAAKARSPSAQPSL